MSATDNDKPVESEVVYSLRDVTDVEQGQGGFVKSLKSESFLFFIYFFLGGGLSEKKVEITARDQFAKVPSQSLF